MRKFLICIGILSVLQTLSCIEGVAPPFQYDELYGKRLSVLDLFHSEDINQHRPLKIIASNAYHREYWQSAIDCQNPDVALSVEAKYLEGLRYVHTMFSCRHSQFEYRKEDWSHKPDLQDISAKINVPSAIGKTIAHLRYVDCEEHFMTGMLTHLVPIGDFGLQVYWEGFESTHDMMNGGLSGLYGSDRFRVQLGARFDSDDKASPWAGFLWHWKRKFLIRGAYEEKIEVHPYRKWYETTAMHWRNRDVHEDMDFAIFSRELTLGLELKIGCMKQEFDWQLIHGDKHYVVDWQNDEYEYIVEDESLHASRLHYRLACSVISFEYQWRDENRLDFEPAHEAEISWQQLALPFLYTGASVGYLHDIHVVGDDYKQWNYGGAISYRGVQNWMFTIRGRMTDDTMPDGLWSDRYQIMLQIGYRQGEYETLPKGRINE